MSQKFRLVKGGRIDRSRPLRFSFDGMQLSGFAGDTLASALLANGVRVVGRSFKYHRPRGLLAAGPEEPNAFVEVGHAGRRTPNQRATEIPLSDGLCARSENTWPSARFDLLSLLGGIHRLLPPGFYHKTFKWPAWSWYEPLIRRIAGIGRAPSAIDSDWYVQRHLHCDVLVIGAGPAGLSAAVAAAGTGSDTVLIDERDGIGGSQPWDAGVAGWIKIMTERLASSGRCLTLTNTCVTGAYEGQGFTAVENIIGDGPRQRLWHIRAKSVVLASGALERPLVFPDNDRPGIMLASAAREYRERYAVIMGRRVVIVTNNDSAYAGIDGLAEAGVTLVGVIDTRPDPGPAAGTLPYGVRLMSGSVPVAVGGLNGCSGIRFAPHVDGCVTTRSSTHLSCDAILISGGWSPNLHLAAQAGAALDFDLASVAFVARTPPQGWYIVGSANGATTLEQCQEQGASAGLAGAAACGINVHAQFASPPPQPTAAPIAPIWFVEFSDGRRHRRQWVDYLYDVTVTDIRIAARENYAHVEHMKRYTAAGMAPDQGKTGQINAHGVLASITGRSLDGTRITTLRPPYRPMTLGVIAGYETGSLYHAYRLLPAHEVHRRHDAQFDEYGGWQRPAFYRCSGESDAEAIMREVLAARNEVVVFDGSPLGKIEVVGRDAGTFLNRIYVNNMTTLAVDKIRYGVMLDDNGTICDDGVVIRLADTHYLVNSTSARATTTYRRLEMLKQCVWGDLDVRLIPVTEQWATFAISGPGARALIRAMGTDIDLDPAAFPHMTHREGLVADIQVRVARVSFTGEVSYEISLRSSLAYDFLELLLRSKSGRVPTLLGIEALGVLRTEKGYLHVGSDTDGATSPLDIGMVGIIAKKKGDFLGRRSLERRHSQQSGRRQLVGLDLGAMRKTVPVGAHIVGDGLKGPSIGVVTSSCWSPTLNRSIAMALIEDGHTRNGQSVTVWSEGRTWPAAVCLLPFLDPAGARLNV